MNLKEVSPRFFVSGQISPGDMQLAAARGIKTIICNRPDDEAAGQPNSQEITDAATAIGIRFLHIPVLSHSISDGDVSDFASACRSADGPVLAYCRSGMRSTALWALMEADSTDVETVLAVAQEAGYDLAGLRPRMESRAATNRQHREAPSNAID